MTKGLAYRITYFYEGGIRKEFKTFIDGSCKDPIKTLNELYKKNKGKIIKIERL